MINRFARDRCARIASLKKYPCFPPRCLKRFFFFLNKGHIFIVIRFVNDRSYCFLGGRLYYYEKNVLVTILYYNELRDTRRQ